MNIKKIIESRRGRYTLGGLIILMILIIVLKIGIEVGYKEAYFSSKLGDNYSKNFLGERGQMMNFLSSGIPGGHGASGTVVRVTPPTMLVATQDNLEKTIRWNDDTTVRKYRNSVDGSEIKVNDSVVVIGYPNDDGEIVARLIRIVPNATSTATTTSIKK